MGFSEIDQYPTTAFCAIHDVDEQLNYGDIRNISAEELPYFDLMTYSFPCKNISIAGNLEGFEQHSNTKSALLWEAMRIAKHKQPKYMIAENVKNLISKRYKQDFDKWIDYLDKLGYKTYWKVLNSEGFNIPQHRERVYVVSIRKDIKQVFFFPEEKELGFILDDFLNPIVDEKYYLSDDALEYMNRKTKDGRTHWDFGHHSYSDNVAKTITANIYKGVPYGIVRDLNRRLTPLECWRLMGFEDKDYWKARFALEKEYYYGYEKSDKRMYKMAGNSVVVPVLEAIFKNLF